MKFKTRSYFFLLLTVFILALSSCSFSKHKDLNDIRESLVAYAFPEGVKHINFEEGLATNYRGYLRKELIYSNEAFSSIAYRFSALEKLAEQKSKIYIVHAGHGQHPLKAWHIIEALLKQGNTVYAIGMPCSEHIPCLGSTHWRHEILYGFVELKSPLGAMLAQSVAAINHSKSNKVVMTGISGGGWTTVLTAAIDKRVTRSIPVAGSLPLDMYEHGKPLGDAEQVDPSMLEICDYRCLYALGASNGIQIQINNSHDPCCFAGYAPLKYQQEVQNMVMGEGVFRVVIDENAEHTYGEQAISYILEQ